VGLPSRFSTSGMGCLEILSEDGGFVFCRGWRDVGDGRRDGVLIVLLASERPAPTNLDRLAHEYSFKDELESTWAARPLELLRDRGQTILVLEDPGGELLGNLLGAPMEVGPFLRIALGIVAALGKAHRRGIIHKDIKPANILVNGVGGEEVRLTGFGVASRLARERQLPDPPEAIAGTLAYMAPEQTGRMNRSVDSRSDLYSLGVTLYEMLTGSLPFATSDPMEWVHCHIARNPASPSSRLDTVPSPLSAIVMKLLAKTAEERYQTAGGVERDLRRCLADWTRDSLADFPLGEQDAPDRLLIPERLYGREHEIATLLASFDRVVKSGAPELVLVSGYSGIGKSSVVNELHPVLVPPRGHFASGKFDQYKRDIPYSTMAQAFQGLIRQLLSKSDAELNGWRDALKDTLGPNARLITDLVPELKLIIGEQPAVSELPPQDARRRFQQVFKRFIGVFARPEHPLALFLDDLQWLDAATLDLIEDVLAGSDLQHVLLIGAFRDNEVGDAHPLRSKLDAIKGAGGKVSEIALGPLDCDHLGQFLADALRCDQERTALLAQLLRDKTGGNPFFAIQFVASLAEEGMLSFDHAGARWSWDIDRIHAKRYTDNIVELMVEKLNRLPPATQQALKLLACLGNAATVGALSIALETTEEVAHEALWPAVGNELAERDGSSYKFTHDRIQEAAYLLVPEGLRAETHLRIGKLLVANIPTKQRAEAIFEIVTQFERCIELVTSSYDREQLAELYLVAGKRAQASSAYVSALNYLATGAALLTEDSWRQRRELCFALELARAHCEFASGKTAEAEERSRSLSVRAITTAEHTAVASLQVDLYQTIDRSDEAVAAGLRALRLLGVDLSERPTEADVRRAYDEIWTRLGVRAIEDLAHLPLMSDPDSLAAVDLLIRVAIPARYIGSHSLFVVAVCTAVSMGLERGHSDASCIAYVQLCALAGSSFGQSDAGYRFGRLGCELAERPGLQRFQARTVETFGFALPWTQHVRKGREFLVRGFNLAVRIGDINYAGYACGHLNANYLVAGDPLIEVQKQAEDGLAFVRKVGFGTIEGWMLGQLGLIRSLRGLTARLGSFNDAAFRESDLERDLAGKPKLALTECLYYIRKLQARFLAGEYVDGLAAASMTHWKIHGPLELVEYHFYDALCHAAVHESASLGGRKVHRARVVEHLEKLEAWALQCPENFANRAALVGAELARIEERDADAMRLYEQAIRSARERGFVQNEAIAYEVAARFYNVRGFEKFAKAYLREARDCYLHWGADGKVRQLDGLYPHLRSPEGQHSAAAVGSVIQHLDAATAVKASQALSGEIELRKLIDLLMTIALENAGAGRGLLILQSDGEYLVQAEARATGDQIDVTIRQEPITGIACPESIVRYVIRTRESVILDDASKPNLFSADGYLRDRQSKSILCLPLIKQRELAGVLLFENALASHAFTPDRIAVLEVLAAQAAISLENSRLYGELQLAGADLRLQVELLQQLPVSAWTLKPDGTPDFVNRVWLEFAGQTLDFVRSHPEAWMTAVHPEDRESAAQSFWKGVQSGQGFGFECRSLRAQDGVYRRHLQQAVVLRDAEGKILKFVGTTTDIDDQKRAEEALRQAAAELAHANRIATMGQLTASIAHEVNQPIAALLTNAETAARWLDHRPSNVHRARPLIDRIISDVNRTADIVSRIRGFSKNTPVRPEVLKVNEVILEVLGLTRAAISDHGVSANTELAQDLPRLLADRVQLQQVILNLVMNAIEAMSEVSEGSRELLISTKAESDSVFVAVRDTGPGLTQASAARIFEAFYTTKSGGLGMGLSICRSIVEAHGGRLWATPCEPHGAVFCMMLPIREQALENREQAGS
jgi:PAS domain S-box-containing protein